MAQAFSLWRKCPRRVDLSAYADGELSEVARERIAAHLKGCAACRRELDSLTALSGEVRSAFQELAQAAALPPTLALPRRWADAATGSPRAKPPVAVLLRRVVAVAAVTSLLLAVAWLLWRTPVSEEGQRDMVQPQPRQEPTVEAAAVRPDEQPVEVVVEPSEPLRADVFALAQTGDPEARAQMELLGLNGKLLAEARAPSREPLALVPVSDLLLEEEIRVLWNWRFTGERP